MTSIQNSTAALGQTINNNDAPSTQAQSTKASGSIGLNVPSLLKELATIAQSFYSSASSNDKADNAPELPPATRSFSADEMVALLRTLQEKTQQSQLQGAQAELETKETELQKNHEAQMEKINEWVEKSTAKPSLLQRILGWAGKILALVAAVAAVAVTAATAGAASPLMLLAGAGLIAAGIGIVDQACKEAGKDGFSLGQMVSKLVTSVLAALGVSEETASKVARVITGALATLTMSALLVEPSLLTDLIGGICDLAGVDKEKLAIIETVITAVASLTIGLVMSIASANVSKAAQGIMKTIGDLTKALVPVAVNITNDVLKNVGDFKAMSAQSAKQALSAIAVALQQALEENQEAIQKLIKQIEETAQILMRMLNDSSDSMEQVSSNLRTAPTV
ncbi:type III secretion system translocon subunit SctE [Alcaligenes endophyticus]|uniref:Type III secretion system translocon subunit SctE n=1 Tax=Alcaligenes endophyticus TaxID=1929088 RepID=A0ABT8EFJ2_9BURK|nr:type III secretion system translocon subunit SctE [Alcaligenes endophyticus]MCX5590270.1 type III secretion system translocon subunit SctE [Alcaligenes endophyticus]MDN4120066.1 type III secretion system translocon subunit SctE [Alcaligenes endophyticus]